MAMVKMLRRLLNTIIETTLNIQPYYVNMNVFPTGELEHLGWLSSISPCFPICGDSIKIIKDPEVFYKTLIQRSIEAKYRITLASLYLGTGELEKTFVDTIAQNKNFINGNLKVSVLLDYTRGSRYEINSRTMLLPLLQKRESNTDICLYHTPCLRGIKKRVTPPRFNEIFGLQHMKLYIFDDYLIISGANLSNDYFTNRQDRYFQIKDKKLADFYNGLVSRVQEFSLRLDSNNEVGLNDNWDQLPYEGPKEQFARKAGDLIRNYMLDSKCYMTDLGKPKDADTWVFPLIQMGQLGVQQDSIVTERLLAQAPEGTKMFMATGYFNLTSRYSSTLVKNSVAECKLLMAHPDANGFQGAKGAAGGIPAAYSLIAYNFHRLLEKEGQENRVSLQEYLKKGWTYHAKGLWYYPPHKDTPCLTLIGSPNFGERSVRKDLETQLAIVTKNENLRERLHEECRYLYDQALPADVNRPVPKWVYAMVFLFKRYF